nr:unnamed protein product [Callosobruchus analis]
MFRQHLPSYGKNLENKTGETIRSTKSDAANDKDLEQLKLTLKSIFDSIKRQAAGNTKESLEETELVMSRNVKEGEPVYLSGIIQKVKQCAKQIIESGKDKINSLMEEVERVIEDISKIRDCKGTKEEKHECIQQNIDLVNQDISDLIEDSSKQFQWLMNDILPDFFKCVTTEDDLLLAK